MAMETAPDHGVSARFEDGGHEQKKESERCPH